PSSRRATGSTPSAPILPTTPASWPRRRASGRGATAWAGSVGDGRSFPTPPPDFRASYPSWPSPSVLRPSHDPPDLRRRDAPAPQPRPPPRRAARDARLPRRRPPRGAPPRRLRGRPARRHRDGVSGAAARGASRRDPAGRRLPPPRHGDDAGRARRGLRPPAPRRMLRARPRAGGPRAVVQRAGGSAGLLPRARFADRRPRVRDRGDRAALRDVVRGVRACGGWFGTSRRPSFRATVILAGCPDERNRTGYVKRERRRA